MEKSHKIYNLIFDFLLAAGVCFYNDLRFMRVWFLGGQLYHSVGFANYRFGLTGKEVCWGFSPLNILHCLQGYDPHAYLKFLCFFCIGILMFSGLCSGHQSFFRGCLRGCSVSAPGILQSLSCTICFSPPPELFFWISATGFSTSPAHGLLLPS